jgi:hypothetical protein
MPPNKAYLDSSHKLIFTFDVDDAEGPTAVVSPASVSGALGLRAMMKSRARGANR